MARTKWFVAGEILMVTARSESGQQDTQEVKAVEIREYHNSMNDKSKSRCPHNLHSRNSHRANLQIAKHR